MAMPIQNGYVSGGYGQMGGYAAGGWGNRGNWNQGFTNMNGGMHVGNGMANGYYSGAGGYNHQSHHQIPQQSHHPASQNQSQQQGIPATPECGVETVENQSKQGTAPDELSTTTDTTREQQHDGGGRREESEVGSPSATEKNTGAAETAASQAIIPEVTEKNVQSAGPITQGTTGVSGAYPHMMPPMNNGMIPNFTSVMSSSGIPLPGPYPGHQGNYFGPGIGMMPTWNGHGGFGQIQTGPMRVIPPAVNKGVEGAPTAPRALREGHGRWPRFGRSIPPGGRLPTAGADSNGYLITTSLTYVHFTDVSFLETP